MVNLETEPITRFVACKMTKKQVNCELKTLAEQSASRV